MRYSVNFAGRVLVLHFRVSVVRATVSAEDVDRLEEALLLLGLEGARIRYKGLLDGYIEIERMPRV